MPWHFAEHVACVHWARPKRTFCTRAQPSRRVAPLAFARPQGRPPGLAQTPEPSRPPLEPHSIAVRSAMAASDWPQQAPALDGAARATLARQLAPGVVPAR